MAKHRRSLCTPAPDQRLSSDSLPIVPSSHRRSHSQGVPTTTDTKTSLRPNVSSRRHSNLDGVFYHTKPLGAPTTSKSSRSNLQVDSAAPKIVPSALKDTGLVLVDGVWYDEQLWDAKSKSTSNGSEMIVPSDLLPRVFDVSSEYLVDVKGKRIPWKDIVKGRPTYDQLLSKRTR